MNEVDNKTSDRIQRKASCTALSATFLFAVSVVCILLFCGLYRPFPPPPEYGIEVNLGYADAGSGTLSDMDPVADEQTAVQSEENVPEEEQVLTSAEEEAPALPQTPVASKPKPKPRPEVPAKAEPQPEKVREEPEINPMALYPGKRKGSNPSSQGETASAGDQGNPSGDINAQGYTGTGGSGGISFSLNGRTLMSLVKPNYDSEEEGIVVVRIWVNRGGTVTRVRAGVKGTTTLDENLWKTAEQAAMRSSFVPKENAPEEQVGTISYRFVRGI